MEFIGAFLIIAVFVLIMAIVGYISIRCFNNGEIVLGLVGLILFLIGFGPIVYMGYDVIKTSNSEIVTEFVEVSVIDKKYSPSSTNTIYINSIPAIITDDEEYNVKIEDEKGDSYVINDKELYDSVEINSKFKLYKDTYYNGNKIYKFIYRLN